MRQQAAQHLRRPRVLIINTKRQYHKFHAPFYRRLECMANNEREELINKMLARILFA